MMLYILKCGHLKLLKSQNTWNVKTVFILYAQASAASLAQFSALKTINNNSEKIYHNSIAYTISKQTDRNPHPHFIYM